MLPRILFIQTFYDDFLRELYNERPMLRDLDFEEQSRQVFATGFGVGDVHSAELRVLGCEAQEVIANADVLQSQWALEHGLAHEHNIHDRRRQVVAAQVADYRPDIVYVFEWCPLGDAFLGELRSDARRLVGQIASPLPPNRTFAAYDLMISSCPPIVDHFRKNGTDAAYLKLAFDSRILDNLAKPSPDIDVSFVAGFAESHPDRIPWLERIMQDINVDVFGYGIERTRPDSPIRKRHHGPVWGLGMYETLQRSRLTLNRHAHIDVRGSVDRRYANNMRLYEATGVGTCLLTEYKENLPEMFEPDREVIAYDDEADCIDKIRYYLSHDDKREAVAQAGRQRTLRDHTYNTRLAQLLDILKQRR